jgi:hypothetical protein
MWSATAARLAGLPQVVTVADLRAAGVDPDVARRAVAAGTWRDLLPGAWLRAFDEPRRDQVQQAALGVLGPGAMLSGVDACLALELRDVPADPLTTVLVGPSVQRDLGPQVRLVRTADVPDFFVRAGRRFAEPQRAVLDAARSCDVLQDVRALVLAAVADCWVSVDGTREALDAGPRRGSALCRRALIDAELGAASAPEAEAADVVRPEVARRRLPPFVLNRELWLDGRLLGAPDGWLPGLGLGWELDSVRHHGSSAGLDATLRRHDGFTRAGLELLHLTPARLRRDPRAFVLELRDRVAVRAAMAAPEPPGLVLGPRTTAGRLRVPSYVLGT